MKISQSGINLIKEFEGCRLTAYTCPAGVWTIGYGHTKGVKKGMTITQDQADAYLEDDILSYERYVSIYASWANQSQFDALVSFAFNCGPGNLQTLVKGRSPEQVGNALLLYNKSNGKVLKGLQRRREAERNLYFSMPVREDEYYPQFVLNEPTIDAIMKQIGADQDYDAGQIGSWKKRIPLAHANGITDYKGTREQNLLLIDRAKTGKLKKVVR